MPMGFCPEARLAQQRPRRHSALEGELLEHTIPQPPQLLLSVWSSTQAPLHHRRPDEHVLEFVPVSVLVLTDVIGMEVVPAVAFVLAKLFVPWLPPVL